MTPNEEAALEELIWEMTAPHTQEEIAARLGLTARTVRRIEAKTLKKLRGLAEGRGWEEGLKDPPKQHKGLGLEHARALGSDGMVPHRIPDL